MEHENMIIQFIGCGKLGTLFLELFLQSGVEGGNIWVETSSPESGKLLSQKYGINRGRAENPSMVFLGIKPQNLSNVDGGGYSADTLVFSPLAGVSIGVLETYISGHMCRIMPNILMQYGYGTTLMYEKSAVSHPLMLWMKSLLDTRGNTIQCDTEEQMDQLATITGCGPAYFFYFAKIFSDILEKNGGLPGQEEETIKNLFLGSAQYFLQSKKSLSECETTVTSKGGITEAALATFAEKGFSDMIQSGLDAAYIRGKELSQQ